MVEGISVGVIEDHPLYRAAVARVLAEAPDVRVDAVAESVTQFAARGSGAACVVLLDLGLPGVRDAAAVLEVAGMGHRVLVLSARADPDDVRNALTAGAWGYLCKSADAEEILRAVRQVAAGVRPRVPLPRNEIPRPRIELSGREAEVLSRLAAGERDEDIAAVLKISVRTVRSY